MQNDGWHPVDHPKEVVFDTYLTVRGDGFDSIRVKWWLTDPVRVEYLPWLEGELSVKTKIPDEVLAEAKQSVAQMEPPTDFVVTNHGSVFQFNPLSDTAKVFTNEQLGLESWQRLGNTFNVDHRPARQLIDQLRDEGFTVVEG